MLKCDVFFFPIGYPPNWPLEKRIECMGVRNLTDTHRDSKAGHICEVSTEDHNHSSNNLSARTVLPAD